MSCERTKRELNVGLGGLALDLILDDDSWISIDGRDSHATLSQQFHVVLHSPTGFVKTIFHGVTDAREAGQVGRVESKIFWNGRRLDDQ